jgi:hypothetical protein
MSDIPTQLRNWVSSLTTELKAHAEIFCGQYSLSSCCFYPPQGNPFSFYTSGSRRGGRRGRGKTPKFLTITGQRELFAQAEALFKAASDDDKSTAGQELIMTAAKLMANYQASQQ